MQDKHNASLVKAMKKCQWTHLKKVQDILESVKVMESHQDVIEDHADAMVLNSAPPLPLPIPMASRSHGWQVQEEEEEQEVAKKERERDWEEVLRVLREEKEEERG
ncbi:hypothetical protein DACRYDRAFT_109527 [Dacryopinax primogenitus]|uniref:Uncharacterized protein n=1 Tax=Dacryopinax primogenitus (strain DJM 731) TaxID=1858805 RepID=M5G2N0_DACPD|nr:uncharacterized protein DACRYDRAFT_109527 [Dacryopinax primogenitus]EJU00107.1 hypothetical protein DACRYDRAFT_109527 [Dacryopinax primogenitus]